MDVVLSALLAGPPHVATLRRAFIAKMPRVIAVAEDNSTEHSSVAAMISYDLPALAAFLHDRFEHDERKMNRGGVARMLAREPREKAAQRVIVYCQLAAICAVLRGDRERLAFYRGRALFAFQVYATRQPHDPLTLEHRLGAFFDQLLFYR